MKYAYKEVFDALMGNFPAHWRCTPKGMHAFVGGFMVTAQRTIHSDSGSVCYEARFGPYEYRDAKAGAIYQKALDIVTDRMLAQLGVDKENTDDES